MHCGLLGQKLGHSYSPQIHQHLGCCSYSLFEKEPEDLHAFLKSTVFTGLNVTIPYKKVVAGFCDQLSERAAKLGAVNTVVRRNNGMLIGHNTDYFGFLSMVRKSGLRIDGRKVLLLGSGGASVTALAVLEELGANVVVVSRSGENNYDNLHLHQDASVIVNATPVGMYPHTGVSPVNLDLFPNLKGVLDIVYNPARTQLLLDAERRGLITENGLWMLVAQAKESAEWFTNTKIPDEKIAEIYAVLSKQMKNIVLIGMPGCGKSTIGKLLAQKLGRKFIDVDEEIVNQAGISIPAIFSESGETGFRQLETSVLARLGKESETVIATGGGCVTRPENYPLLHQNSTIIWIHRDIHALPTSGRPLSQNNRLEDMYQLRRPMYESYCDLQIINNKTPDDAVEQILSLEGYQ